MQDGKIHELWIASCLDALMTIVLLYACFLFDSRIAAIVTATDYSMITMSDYSVFIAPRNANYFEGELAKKDRRDDFILELDKYLSDNVLRHDKSSVKVARIIDDEGRGEVPAIWPAYDEDENIRLWNNKTRALLRLESKITAECARHKALEENLEDSLEEIDSTLTCLENIRDELLKVDEDIKFHAIGAFVTFDLVRAPSTHERALAAPSPQAVLSSTDRLSSTRRVGPISQPPCDTPMWATQSA